MKGLNINSTSKEDVQHSFYQKFYKVQHKPNQRFCQRLKQCISTKLVNMKLAVVSKML